MPKDNNAAVSFEFFPPKSEQGFRHLVDCALQLQGLNPNYFSVTYGAGGSTQTGTLSAVKLLLAETKTEVAPHLSCIGAQRSELLQILDEYINLNVARIVALRGDLPSGMGPAGSFRYAYELVELIRRHCGDAMHIVVAAYPESHPQSRDAKQDLYHFKQKVDAGASSAVTQYFFNCDAYFDYVDRATQLGITIPVVPGIMPIHQFAKVVRFSDQCGTEVPRWLRKRLEAYYDDEHALRAFGADFIYQLCERLLQGGAPGLHFYTLNQADLSYLIAERLISM